MPKALVNKEWFEYRVYTYDGALRGVYTTRKSAVEHHPTYKSWGKIKKISLGWGKYRP